MKSTSTLTSRLAGLTGAVLLGGLVACSHGGGASAVASGSGTVVVFSLADMEGDWIGQMIPDSPSKPKRNFYLRVVNGVLVEAADSAKSEWRENDSLRTLDVAQDGELMVELDSLPVNSNLILDGLMGLDKSSITGTYSYSGSAQLESDGTFELIRSSGPGQFGMDLITGDFEGFGYNVLSERRDIELQIDTATGAVISARIFRADGTDVHVYSAGSGTFSYFDDAIGRLEDVVLIADDAAITTFEYLLVDLDGELMGGVGHDTRLGHGIIELRRP